MFWLLLAMLAFDLTTARNEPNLEKRSDLAMKNADTSVTAVREATAKGDDAALKAALDELRASVDLSVQSLTDANVNPRRANSYKRAELAAGQLLRRLDSIRQSVSVVDQEAIDPVRAHVSEIHDKLLSSIMAKKKK